MKTIIDTFPARHDLIDLIRLAKAEDFAGDDVTSRLLIPTDQIGQATLTQRGHGVCCGLPIVGMICNEYDPALRANPAGGASLHDIEGKYNDAPRTPLMTITGPMRSLLSAERVVLNFLQRIGGVATLTHRFVQAVQGTRAKIYDTRKTLPGHRLLDKYAVRAGGGINHRIGLYDGLLVKDNHLADIPINQLVDKLSAIVCQSRAESSTRLVEIEVDSHDQLAEVLKVPGVDVILLDNMDCPAMSRAVEMRDRAGSQVQLEASGGVKLEAVRAIAQTGVDRIAIGALTHSAPALDIGLDID